jgi:hypothetical protein
MLSIRGHSAVRRPRDKPVVAVTRPQSSRPPTRPDRQQADLSCRGSVPRLSKRIRSARISWLQSLAALLEDSPREHDASSATETYQSDVSSDAHHSPSRASARVRLPQCRDVVHAHIYRHLPTSRSSHGPTDRCAFPSAASRARARLSGPRRPIRRCLRECYRATRFLPICHRRDVRQHHSHPLRRDALLSH